VKLTFYIGIDGTICSYSQTYAAYLLEESKHFIYCLVELN